MTQQSDNVIDRWHDMMAHGTTEGLYDLLAPDCVFWSPVVHTPQRGRDITHMYLSAAGQVFDTDFRYVREVRDGDSAVLEFECTLDGVHVNGIDMITWNHKGKIIDFKVMIRPLKAVEIVRMKMVESLEVLSNNS